MRIGWKALAAVGVMVAAGQTAPALAQTSSQLCSNYASQAVSTFQQGQMRGCNMGASGLSADYGKMFNKCYSWPNVRTQSETRGLGAVLQVACRAPAPRRPGPPQGMPFGGPQPFGGPPPAPPRAAAPPPPRQDASRHSVCASFARYATSHSRRAKAVGCNVGTWHDNEAGHYKWCMGTDDASFRVRSPEARGFEADLKKRCAAQGRYF